MIVAKTRFHFSAIYSWLFSSQQSCTLYVLMSIKKILATPFCARNVSTRRNLSTSDTEICSQLSKIFPIYVQYGFTKLYRTAGRGNLILTKELIKKGADVNIKTLVIYCAFLTIKFIFCQAVEAIRAPPFFMFLSPFLVIIHHPFAYYATKGGEYSVIIFAWPGLP